MRAARCRRLDFTRQENRDRREDQDDPDHRKGIAEPQYQGLALDRIAERDDRLVLRGGRVGDTMGQEIVGRLRDALTYFLTAEVDRRRSKDLVPEPTSFNSVRPVLVANVSRQLNKQCPRGGATGSSPWFRRGEELRAPPHVFVEGVP